MKKLLIFLAVVAVVAVAGAWGYQNFVAKAAEPAAEREKAVVRTGDLVAVINTTGTILPEKETTLTFGGAGRIVEVRVKEGQAVHQGEALARLETAELEFAIAQAELTLAAAQAELERLHKPAAEPDVAAAQAALKSAREAYHKLKAGPTPEEIEVARANLEQVEAALKQAQMAYDLVAARPDVGMLPESLQLEQATIAYEAAEADFELATRPASKADLAAARSAIAQAEATLAQLRASPANLDLRIAQLQVEQAQLSLDQARHRLEDAVLVAPHDGVVTSVAVRAGEVAGGQPAFVLTDLAEYHLQANADEIDVGRLAEGQPVTVTLDALPDAILTGRVDRIAETAQREGGIVTYRMTIRLTPSDAPLRGGMTADVDIVTERHEKVLLVPNRFVRIDRDTGKAYVERLAGEQIQAVEIVLGLRDELYSEVLSGLSEGDVVVLTKRSSRDELQDSVMLEF